MAEQLRAITIRVEIDTNKATYRTTVDSLAELVEWWNAHSDLGIGEYTIDEDDEDTEEPKAVGSVERLGADRLAGEVQRLVSRRVIDARSPAGDALLDYASTRFGPRDPLCDLDRRFADIETLLGRGLDARARWQSAVWKLPNE